MNRCVRLHIKGIVQGVGFRPFVYREAKKHLISGWVLNASDGVYVEGEGEEKNVASFIMALSENAPAASSVKEISIEDIPLQHFEGFEISMSDEDSVNEKTLVSPDIAMCTDCMRELFDKNDRRYRYPFINCTNCGPRFTIIDELPYDRPKTSMKKFPMCETCESEYRDPANRRFHAQPNACFECGPHVYLDDFCSIKEGTNLEISEAIFSECARRLRDGEILAVKGLGGFHLVCDGKNPEALNKLRARKHRDNKAFAVMMKSVDVVRGFCNVSDAEACILDSPEKPIVLLKKLSSISQNSRSYGDSYLTQKITHESINDVFESDDNCSDTSAAKCSNEDFSASSCNACFNLPDALSGDLPELGVMLPYTPVQALLLESFEKVSNDDSAVLVMTSGNLHDEPIVTDDDVAKTKFLGIADAILGNDREILTRFDDSVVRVLDFGNNESAVQMIRRARGYAPRPLSVPFENDFETFATGPEQKNTFTFVRKQHAFVSQHIGDVEDVDVSDAWFETKSRFENLFDLSDHCAIVCDKHPEYLTSKWAKKHVIEAEEPLGFDEVYHHHAHIVSAMAENGIDEATIGFSFDGTGFGADGCIWGGEVLLSNLETYERVANFAYFPLPSGAGAVKKPTRTAYGLLYSCDLLDEASEFVSEMGDEAKACESLIESSTNTPYTSSVGRLFDGVATLLGICVQPTYEGEAAIELEAAMFNFEFDDYDSDDARYAFEVQKNSATEHSTALDTSMFVIDPKKVVAAILEDIRNNVDKAVIARRFHDAIVKLVRLIAQITYQIYGIKKCVLAGGVWMNRYLCESSVAALESDGFDVILNRDLPPNDGGVSYGQAIVNCARHRAKAVEE